MPGDHRREILELVASGHLTPEEAAQRLVEAEVGGSTASTEAVPPPKPNLGEPPRSGGGDVGIAQVRVRGNCRAVSIVGDPNVLTAVAEGEHAARVEGDLLVIESLIEKTHGFAFIRSPGIRSRARVRIGSDTVRPLTIRMNPSLALEAHVDAGSMTIRGVHGPIRANTSAGAVRIDDFEGPIELRVAAGSASVRGRLRAGTSRVECDAGKVTMRLTPDSNVTIRGRVNLGQLMTPDVVGAGDARLDVVANLGAIEISVDDGGDGDDEGDGDYRHHEPDDDHDHGGPYGGPFGGPGDGGMA